MQKLILAVLGLSLASITLGCDGRNVIYTVANGCYALATVNYADPPPHVTRYLDVAASATEYEFAAMAKADATPFFLEPSELGTYLLYDDEGSYVVSDGTDIGRADALSSDISSIDDSFESPAEWNLVLPARGHRPLYLQHRSSGRYLAEVGLVDGVEDAARIHLTKAQGCAEFPELSLDAEGRAYVTEYDDGSLFGIVDTHSHILSNFAFGGGGIFHGAPFHRLGVEHALADCAQFHGIDGRQDLFGWGFENPGDSNGLLQALVFGETPEANHATAGYPDFIDWPNAPSSSTHQTQYYRWLQRAYLGGLRLVVQHATTNQIICDIMVGLGVQETRYECNDMVAVDRIVDEVYAMENYIDAQEGGPGKGWFRVVTSPADAREVIADGKMAVILGIETSNLFDCFLVPSDEYPACSEQDVLDRLNGYHERGVRAIFPVHKYDNGFSAGDGHKEIIELGNWIQTGHTSNYTNDCDTDTPTVFDKGQAAFPALIGVREDYFAAPPFDFSNFTDDPLGSLVPHVGLLLTPPNGEEVCQAAGVTPLGEFLVEQLMERGMIIEIDHMPRRTYKRVFEMLVDNDYPAAGTHGINNSGDLYALGGVSKSGFGTCRSATETSTVDNGYQNRIALIEANGGFPAEGFGFDLNGFAGARGPRFGPNGCSTPQTDPITYPFTSYAGDVTFTAPQVGDRSIDFNTEGFVHIGMLPELIEDVRGDGVSDADLEPLFRSAEGYIRMWEKAELRGAALRGE